MASSDQTFNSNIPCEVTNIISAQSASIYQKELDSKTRNKSGKPLTSAEIAFRLDKLKGYKQTLAPKWRRKFEERMKDIEAKMEGHVTAEVDRVIDGMDKTIQK